MKLRIEKRQTQSTLFNLLSPVFCLLLALSVVAVFLLIAGVNPISAYRDVGLEALGSAYGLSETLVQATPLILTGLGVMLAFRMQLWNIGAEGQLLMGALASTWVALFSGITTGWLMIPCMMIASMIAGGIWAAIAGALKARYRVNEVIITLLLNYVAAGLVKFLVYGSWRDPNGYGFPQSADFPKSAVLDTYFDTRLHTGFWIALGLAAVLWVFTEKTIWGYELKVIGNNPRAAKYAGMNIQAKTIFMMFLSGALAALAGFAQVSGVVTRMQDGISPGYGFTAVIVAWLARRSAIGVVIVSFLFGVVYVGGDALKITYKLPEAFINIFQGMLLFFLLASEFFVSNRVSLVRSTPTTSPPTSTPTPA